MSAPDFPVLPDPLGAVVHGQSPGEEHRHLAAVEQDLLREFPALTPQQVRQRFASIVRDFEGAPIRDFVPVLVRKRALQELRADSI